MNTESVNAANQIVTNHLVKSFIQEVDFFYQIVEQGEQLIVFDKEKSLFVLDISGNKDSASLIEKFCYLFSSKSNILVDVRVDEMKTFETLILTMQDGSVYFMQDFSKRHLKL